MTYTFDFTQVIAAWPELLMGVLRTLQLSVAAIVLSIGLGILGASAKIWGAAPLRAAVSVYVNIFRNTPFVVQLYFLFFGLPSIGLLMDRNTAALVALSIYGGAYMVEIVKAGINSVPPGQKEAGAALGLSGVAVFRHIIMRPALRTMYPALVGQSMLILLTSSIVSAISVEELTYAAQAIESMTFRSFESYLAVLVIYFALTLAVSWAFAAIGRRAFNYPT